MSSSIDQHVFLFIYKLGEGNRIKHVHVHVLGRKAKPTSSMSVLPWLTLATVVWLQAISGTNTDFPAYSTELKHRLGISQIKLNNLAAASDAGKIFGWLSGVAAARLPLWSVVAIGAALGTAGYSMQFLFFSHKISSLSYLQFFFLNMINGTSVCWLNTVGYTAVLRQFLPKDHGTVLALTTSYTGLTAKIYMALAEVIVGKKKAERDKGIYLLLNALTPAVVSLLVMLSLVSVETKPTQVKAGLITMFGIAVVTGVYAVIYTMLPALRNLSGPTPATILLVMVAAVVLVPVKKAGEWVMRGTAEEPKVAEVKMSGIGDVEGGKEEEGDEEMAEKGAVAERSLTEENVNGVCELVKRVNFWVYFIVYLCGATLGLVYNNNIGQVSDSRGISASTMVSISSSFGFFGRLATAPLSAFSRSGNRIPKTGIIAVLMVAMAGSFFLLLFPGDAFLFFSTAVIGFCSGAISSIAVSVSSELFGQENFGVNHNIVIVNVPIGSFVFGSIATAIYDDGDDEVPDSVHGLCVGMQCYKKTFMIWGCVCSFGTILSFVLYYRTRISSRTCR